MAIDIMRSLAGRPRTYWSHTPTYGRKEYGQSLQDWQKMMGDYSGMMSNILPTLGQMSGYYAPGGGYGKGLRTEAEEAIKSGLAKDLGNLVSTGMSTQFGARGLQTRAGSELAKLYQNIEDARNQYWMQSVQPYAQIMSQMANMMQTRPTFGQYFRTGGTARPHSVNMTD